MQFDFDSVGENVYGHRKRFDWIEERLDRSQRIVEFGCGTGVMLTLPLARRGYDIVGVDSDGDSIEFGREIARANGHAEERLQVADLSQLPFAPDVVIASEVLEHIPDDALPAVVDEIRSVLPAGGRFLVTVPNGYGWFELESWAWNRGRLGALVELLRVDRIVRKLKQAAGWRPSPEPPLSTLADSPHVQRFTPSKITQLLEGGGFDVRSFQGSVLFAGPVVNMLFRDVQWFLTINRRLGSRWPRLASGWFLDCVRSSR